MSFNKRISKFLVSIAIGSCILSNFNCYVQGMEKSNEVPKDKYQLASDEIFIMFKDFINKNNLQDDTAKWYVAFDILLFLKNNFNEYNVNYLKKMGKINEKDILGSIHKILLDCMLKPEKPFPFEGISYCNLNLRRLNYLGKDLIKKFCYCLMTRLKNICYRNTMLEDERIENFIDILKNVRLTSLYGSVKRIDSVEDNDSVEDKLKKLGNMQCGICYTTESNFSTMIPCGHQLCECCFYRHSLEQKYEYGKENVPCPYCRKPIDDFITLWEQYKNN